MKRKIAIIISTVLLFTLSFGSISAFANIPIVEIKTENGTWYGVSSNGAIKFKNIKSSYFALTDSGKTYFKSKSKNFKFVYSTRVGKANVPVRLRLKLEYYKNNKTKPYKTNYKYKVIKKNTKKKIYTLKYKSKFPINLNSNVKGVKKVKYSKGKHIIVQAKNGKKYKYKKEIYTSVDFQIKIGDCWMNPEDYDED